MAAQVSVAPGPGEALQKYIEREYVTWGKAL